MECEKILDDMNEIVSKMQFKEEIDYAISCIDEFLDEED